jgi:hypothetical protein
MSMVISEALVTTGRADRYLEQFAKHFDHQPGGIQARRDGDGRLVVDFGAATCTMQVTGEGLKLSAEAAEIEELGEVQARLAERIEQIGRRDGIAVRWMPDFTAVSGQRSAGHRRH